MRIDAERKRGREKERKSENEWQRVAKNADRPWDCYGISHFS
jgi:hypothetical protein